MRGMCYGWWGGGGGGTFKQQHTPPHCISLVLRTCSCFHCSSSSPALVHVTFSFDTSMAAVGLAAIQKQAVLFPLYNCTC